MTFWFQDPCCCVGPTLGVCWSIDWKHAANGFLNPGDPHYGELIDYHLVELDERTGEIRYDRTIDGWCVDHTSGSSYYSDWVYDTDPTAQEEIDLRAGCGSLNVDPSGAWCVFTNRYRLIVTRNSVTRVWDGNSGNAGLDPGDFYRGSDYTGYLHFNSSAFGSIGGLSKFVGYAWGGDQPPFSLMTAMTGGHPYDLLTPYLGSGTLLPDGRYAHFSNNGAAIGFGLPALLRYAVGSPGSISGTNLYSIQSYSGGDPDTYWWRVHGMYGLDAMADGSLIAVQTNYEHAGAPAGIFHYEQEWCRYNDNPAWTTNLSAGVGTGSFAAHIGPNADRTTTAIVAFIGGDRKIKTVDVDQNIVDYSVPDPPGYNCSNFASPPYYSLYGLPTTPLTGAGAIPPICSQSGNAVLFCGYSAHTQITIIARFNLDTEEWDWVTELPNETGFTIKPWALAARP